MEDELAQIGADLLLYASESAEFSASRGIVTELFPYIYAASRTMSSRAISRWLEEQHKVKLSAVTISKALREPQKHWIGFTEDLEPSVRILEEAFPDFAAKDFLSDERLFAHMVEAPPMLSGENQDQIEQTWGEVRKAIQTIQDRWILLPGAVRSECVQYLLVEDVKEEPSK